MSIRLPGTIVITRKGGKRGDFNVGELSTEIGDFDVKDALIDEFEPGRYTGLFVISRIHPDSFTWRGRVFVKIRAVLDEILVDEAEEGAPAPAPAPEPDPIDSAPAATGSAATDATATPERSAAQARRRPARPAAPAGGGGEAANGESAGPGASPSASSGEVASGKAPDELLFGSEIFECVSARSAVKLDPVAVDREKFRAQRDRLKTLGYGFDPKTQVWQAKPEAADIPF